MKKFTVVALFALAGLLTAGSSYAQTKNEIRVNVPFAFVVGNKVLPAGNYRIDSESSPLSANEILIQDVDQPRYAVLVNANDGPSDARPLSVADGRLVFNQYGDDRFLREIRGPVAAVNVEIPESRAEHHVQKREMQAPPAVTQTSLNLSH